MKIKKNEEEEKKKKNEEFSENDWCSVIRILTLKFTAKQGYFYSGQKTRLTKKIHNS